MSDPKDEVPPSSKSSKRSSVALWGGASVVAGALLYAGFIYPSTVVPDAATWIGMADVQLQFAQSLANVVETDEHKPRTEAIERAEEILGKVEEHYPGLSITSEFRAFARWVAGDLDAARVHYRSALEREAEDVAVRARITANLASLELEEGRPDDALRELESVSAENASAAIWTTRARAWDAKGKDSKRSEELRAGFASAKASGDESEIFVVAECAAQLGDAIADSAFEYLSKTSYRARYRLAMLKIESGDSDSATSMLTNVAKKAPRDLNLWIRKDREFWSAGSRRAIADKVLTTLAKPNR